MGAGGKSRGVGRSRGGKTRRCHAQVLRDMQGLRLDALTGQMPPSQTERQSQCKRLPALPSLCPLRSGRAALAQGGTRLSSSPKINIVIVGMSKLGVAG